MSILGDVGAAVSGSVDQFISSLTDPFKTHKIPDRFGADFNEFRIIEYVDGVEKSTANKFGIVLVADQMPFQPFSFGGEQKVNKDYYPGNSEPVVQILGPRETDVTVKGRLKAKHFKNPSGKKDGSLYLAPEAIQRQLDAIRIRGNLLFIQLGTWQRWGFLQRTHFDLNQLARIEYELTFALVGFNKPKNVKMIDRTHQIPFDINKDLLAAAAAFKAPPPFTMPKSILGLLNSVIADVASAMALVTNFVDGAVKTAEDAVATVNRAKGLILNARANISRFKRRIRSIGLSIESLGSTFTDKNGGLGTNPGAILGLGNNLPTTQTRATLTTSTYTHASYIQGQISGATQMSDILARLHAQFDALAKTLPMQRYVVKQGDTLQKLAVKFYGNADKWKSIYDHNKLTSTSLVTSKTLEIPKP